MAVAAGAVLAIGVGLVAALWFIVAVTILPTPSIDGDRYVVRWATWPQGQVPVGAVAAVGVDPVRSDLAARVSYLTDPDAFAVVTITGGVRDAATQDPTLTTDHYLITCLAGSCEEFDGRVPVNHVLGEVLGRHTPPMSVAPIDAGNTTPATPGVNTPPPATTTSAPAVPTGESGE